MHSDDHGPVRARVCCATFPLLRLLTLHCTRKRGVAEGEGAQQTEKGAADAGAAPGRGVVDRAAITTTITANAPKTALDPRENRPAREDAP